MLLLLYAPYTSLYSVGLGGGAFASPWFLGEWWHASACHGVSSLRMTCLQNSPARTSCSGGHAAILRGVDFRFDFAREGKKERCPQLGAQ